MRWTVLVPLKTGATAKSRLTPATGDDEAHRRLVYAIRADTLAAAHACPRVARVALVVDGPYHVADETVYAPSEPGLNEGLVEAAAYAARRWPDDGVAALVGDLPALRPEQLGAALDVAAQHARAFAADAAGTGTTLLTARPGAELRPAFGTGSAARHARDAAALEAGAGLRCDVDTPADLDAAAQLGLGPATLLVLDELRARRAGHTTAGTGLG